MSGLENAFEFGGWDRFGWWSVNVVAAVTAVSLAGLGAARLAGGRPAAVRSGLLLAALLLAAVAPLASAASWRAGLGLWPAPRTAAADPVPPVAPRVAAEAPLALPATFAMSPQVLDPALVAPASPPVPPAVSAAEHASLESPAVWRSFFESMNPRFVFDMALLIWIAGAAVGFARLAWSGSRLQRFASSCRDSSSPRALAVLASAAEKVGLSAPPRLAIAPAGCAPAAFGLFRPVVALPEGLVDELDDDELEAVFLHEAGHAAGGDAWVSLLQAVLAAAYWPLLPLHRLSARLSAAREELCDDYVVAAQGAGRRFAEVLVRLAERTASPPPQPALALLDPGPSGLEVRIRRLLRKDRTAMTSLTPTARLGTASFAAALLAFATFAQLRADAPPDAALLVPDAPAPTAPGVPRALDPAGDPNVPNDPNTPPPKRGRMVPRPPAPPAPPGTLPPPPPAPPFTVPKPAIPSQPVAPGFVPDPTAPPKLSDPAAPPVPVAADSTSEPRREADPEKKMAAVLADPDFWSKEGAKSTHDFSPAETAWVMNRSHPARDVRGPGRLRLQKLRCDLEGTARLAATIPPATAQEAAAGAFAWLESKSADSPEARKFDHRQGFTHYFVTPRANAVSADHVWFLIEDVAPNRTSSGLNLRWNTVAKTIDKAEHWGVDREVPAALVEVLAKQAAEAARKPSLEVPEGYEAVAGTHSVKKETLRYRQEQQAADASVETWTTVKVRGSKTGGERLLTRKVIAEELWDLASSPPRALRSKVVFDTGSRFEDAADPNREAP